MLLKEFKITGDFFMGGGAVLPSKNRGEESLKLTLTEIDKMNRLWWSDDMQIHCKSV